jgi:hypothetical protein
MHMHTRVLPCRFCEDQIHDKEVLIEKLSLKNTTYKAAIAKLEVQLAHKEEMGEVRGPATSIGHHGTSEMVCSLLGLHCCNETEQWLWQFPMGSKRGHAHADGSRVMLKCRPAWHVAGPLRAVGACAGCWQCNHLLLLVGAAPGGL